MVHRTVFGSVERFIGILTEHYAGAFPLWLAPVQVAVIPVTRKFSAYAHTVEEQLLQAGIRVEVDDRNEKVGYKIREAQLQKVPYMLIVGEKEAESAAVSVRDRAEGDLGAMATEAFAAKVLEEIKNKH